MKEIESRLDKRKITAEWEIIKRNLNALREIELVSYGETYYLRADLRGVCHNIIRAAGVQVPPDVRM